MNIDLEIAYNNLFDIAEEIGASLFVAVREKGEELFAEQHDLSDTDAMTIANSLLMTYDDNEDFDPSLN